MKKPQLNALKAEFLSRLGLLVNWQNELREICNVAKDNGEDGGTCCLGQGIDIVTADYDVIVHLDYSSYMQGNIKLERITPLINRIQEFIDAQYKEYNLEVMHEAGVMD